MKRLFELTFRPFFVLTGAGTALISVYAFWPAWATQTMAKLAFIQEYTIIVQHWGIMVGLMGVFMIAAAVRPEWRTPILLYSAVEKAFMVYLVVANLSRPYSEGFWVAATVDGTIVLYTIGYFAVCGFGTPAFSAARPRTLA